MTRPGLYGKKEMLRMLLPYSVVFIIMLVIHKDTVLCGDDLAYYAAIPLDRNFASYLLFRYNDWSGRILVECVVVMMNKLGMKAWIIANAGIITSIIWSMNSIINTEKKNNMTWMICLLVMSFPFVTMSSAGWIATSVGYSWTLAAGLAAIVPLSKTLAGEGISYKSIISGTALFIFATDAEQFTTIALIALSSYVVLEKLLFKNNVHFYAKILLAVAMLKLLFILTTPGNHVRMQAEISKWFPKYPEIGFVQKIYIGFMYTARVLLGNPYILITTFILLTLYVFTKKSETWVKVLSLVSTSFVLLLTVGQTWISTATERLQLIRSIISKNETSNNIDFSAISVCLITALALSLAIIIIKCFDDRCWILIALLVLGLLSQMMMLFSPTIYVSSERTGIFMYFCFIIFNALCAKKIIDNNIAWQNIAAWSFCIVVCSLNLLNQLWMR